MIALSAIQSSTPTRIHNVNLFIHLIDASHNNAHSLMGTPCLAIIGSNFSLKSFGLLEPVVSIDILQNFEGNSFCY